jgi:hypothetical protein
VIEGVIGYLLASFLVTGSVCFLSLSYLVYASIKASRAVDKDCDHSPEVVLVPMGGPMTPMKPPTRH